MSEQPKLAFTVEQLFKLVQQNIRLWARPGAQQRIFTQATELAHLLDHCYQQSSDKVIAQLHLHKPHYDFLTNLTAKAAIFATVQVWALGWTEHTRLSIIAATLTTNVAVLPHLLKQNRGEILSDKQKLAVAKSASLSYQVLQKNQVLDPLWLHAVLTSSTGRVSKHYRVGIHGCIIRSAYRFAKPLCRQQAIDNVYVGQILRQLFLSDPYCATAKIVDNAAAHIHNLGSGALVMLNNNQAAMLMHQTAANKYLAFMFSQEQMSAKGRFVTIGHKHIKSQKPLYQCDQPKLYSQLWEGPLRRFAEENQITFESLHCPEIDINQPPKMLDAVLTHLFDNPNLKRLSSAIDSSEVLKQLLTTTATEAAVQKIQITDTKHALAMLGLNRIGPLLIQGVLSDLLNRFNFPGDSWMHDRQNCFIQAAKFYGKHNDLVMAEEQSLYATFYLAPFFVDSTVQNRSYQLYSQIKVKALDAFKPETLINAEVNEQHRNTMNHLIQQWQLPKLGGEVLRQLIKPEEDKRLANTVRSAVAVLRLAAFHCHTTYNDVDISNPLLQQRLSEYLNTLGLSFERFISLQDEFLQQYSPATSLL